MDNINTKNTKNTKYFKYKERAQLLAKKLNLTLLQVDNCKVVQQTHFNTDSWRDIYCYLSGYYTKHYTK